MGQTVSSRLRLHSAPMPQPHRALTALGRRHAAPWTVQSSLLRLHRAPPQRPRTAQTAPGQQTCSDFDSLEQPAAPARSSEALASRSSDSPGQQTCSDSPERPPAPPTFSQLEAPLLVAVDTHSMNLQWTAVQQQPDSAAPECTVSYSLEMQLVTPAARGQPAAEALDDRRWSCCYSGPSNYAQVHAACCVALLSPGPREPHAPVWGGMCRCSGCVLVGDGPFVWSASRSVGHRTFCPSSPSPPPRPTTPHPPPPPLTCNHPRWPSESALHSRWVTVQLTDGEAAC